MKNYRFLFSAVYILLTFGCNNLEKKNDKINSINYKNNQVSINITPRIKYDKTFFLFQLNYDSTGYFLNKIEVYSDDKIHQIIKVNKIIESKRMSFVDWNFDGYKDITIINSQGSGGTNYSIWCYNPNDKKFIYNSDLSDKLGLEIDSISKYIIFHYRAGWQEEYWDTLKFNNSKLVFIKGMYQQQWNDEKGKQWRKRTNRKIIDRKYIDKIDSCIINP
jgi:hypothetical protein